MSGVGGRAHVLLVHPDPGFADQARWALDASVDLAVAGDAMSGLRAVARRRPDLLLLSTDLGDLPATGLVRSLRSQPETAELPVLLVTTKVAPEGLDLVAARAVVGVLSLPVTPIALLQRVLEVLPA